MKSALCLLFATALVLAGSASQDKAGKSKQGNNSQHVPPFRIFNPETLAKPTAGYSQVAEVNAGHLVYIAGQVADLEGEGKSLSATELKYIHERKTSALLCCSARLGGMSANCTASQLEALTLFGYNVGLAFQIIDDILDITQTSEKLGKTAGKDTAAQKATYPSIVGLEKSRKIAQQLTQEAFAALKVFKGKARALEALAAFLLNRDR